MRAIALLKRLLGRELLLAATAGIAILNGLPVTPLFDSVSYVLYLFARGSFIPDPHMLADLATLLIAAMTLLVAGIPAALYERVRGLERSTPVSLGIWLIATALLSMPALARIAGL
jgi:hypothetical protein